MNLYETQYSLLKKYIKEDIRRWSVLITTDHILNIFEQIMDSTLLKENNIASIFLLNSPRSPIKIAHAIYVIDNSTESIDLLINDLQNNFYQTYSLYFLTSITWHDMERLASLNCQKIVKIFDIFFDFTVLNEQFFISNIPTSSDVSYFNAMANSLFSFFYSIDEIPSIVYLKERKFERELARVLQEKFTQRKIIKSSLMDRPLLILYERERDILQPLLHPWTYEGLIFEIFDRTNFVEIEDRKISLNRNDYFWKFSNALIEDAAKEIDQMFTQYKNKLQLKNMENIQQIESSVQNHMKISLKLIEKIREKHIDIFYRCENSKLTGEILTEVENKGSREDITAFLIFKLLTETIDDEMREKILEVAEKRQVNLKLLDYFEKYICRENLVLNRFKSAVSGLFGKISSFLQQTFNTPLSNYVHDVYSGKGEYNIIGKNENISKIIVYEINGGTFNEKKSLDCLSGRIEIPIVYACNEIIMRKNYLSD